MRGQMGGARNDEGERGTDPSELEGPNHEQEAKDFDDILSTTRYQKTAQLSFSNRKNEPQRPRGTREGGPTAEC